MLSMTGRILFFVVLFTMILFQACLASFSPESLHSLLTDSDLVVSGTLIELKIIGEEAVPGARIKLYRGALKVEEVFMGTAPQDMTCHLTWDHCAGLSSSLDPEIFRGKGGIWLLRKAPGRDSYILDHPGRYLPLADRKLVKSSLEMPFFTVEFTEHEGTVGKPFPATFIMHSKRGQLSSANFLTVKGKMLELHGTIFIEVRNTDGDVKATSPVISLKDGSPIIITNGSPRSVTIDLSRFFRFTKGGVHELRWGSSEDLSSPRYTFYLREP
jgi:hypothetical protein